MRGWNVIWLLVDSVRTYRSGLDDRDRIDLMDKMAGETIEFKRVVSSAPSSVMSVSAMMTGMPSYQVARDYENFVFDPQSFSSVPRVLEDNGYGALGLVFYRGGRERFSTLFNQVDRRFWPKKLRRSTARYWTNDEVNSVLQNLLAGGLQEPFFLFVHYNIRKDPGTSAKVEKVVNYFKNSGVYDRSIFILCSDHGYPDPSRGLGPMWFKDRGLSHDLIMSNDNLLIPLLMHYPGAKPCTISTTVSSLDIAPTILDLLQIEPDLKLKSQMEGCSLTPLIEGNVASCDFESRFIRSDNRFTLQVGQTTVFIRGTKKYVFHHDTKQESFFDFEADPLEVSDLINHSGLQEEIATFRKVFTEAQAKARKLHVEYLLQKISRERSSRIDSGGQLLVIDLSNWHDIGMVLDALSNAFNPSTIAVLTDKSNRYGDSLPKTVEVLFLNNLRKKNNVHETLSLYDHLIAIGDRITSEDIHRQLGFMPRKILLLDSNMTPIRPSGWKVFTKFIRARFRFYLKEPMMLIKDLKKAIRRNMPHLLL